MSVWKKLFSKRFWVGMLLLMLVLLGVNGICAMLMTGGLVDHHKTLQAACAAWGIAALVAGRFAGRGKEAVLVESLLVPAVVFLLTLIASFSFGGGGLETGGWWKCGVYGVIGAGLSVVLVPKKKKKRISAGARGKKKKRR